MEWFLDTCAPLITLSLAALCFIWLVAIAATLGKLLKYMDQDGVPLTQEEGELLRGPDYVDQEVLRGRGEPHSDGVSQRSSSNWDGVSRQ